MAWYKSTRMKIGLWLLLILIGGALLTQNYWQPRYYNWRCGHLAAELSEQYGLIMRYGDPSEFYVAPRQVIDYDKYYMEIERVGARSAFIAMKGIQEALSKYPSALLKKHLSAVFISGVIKNYGAQGAGTYAYSWIYVSATPEFDSLGSIFYSETLNHELSSMFLKNSAFPTIRWSELNSPNFNYLKNHIDVLQASSAENRRDLSEAYSWHQAGFVHDYGMASLENDFNTYAELAMTHPQRLKELAQEYPKIQAKTHILVEFYSSLAPELGEYFKSVGLIEEPAME